VIPRRIVASLVLATLLLAACASDDGDVDLTASTETRARADAPVTTQLGDPPLVVVLGDSNTFATSPEIREAFADAGLTADPRGISGSGVKDNALDWLPAAEAVVAAQPAAVVVALGTNDATTAIDATTFGGRARELLDALGPLPVIWVTHTEDGVAHPPEYERQINDAIRALPTSYPNVSVLDLAPRIAAEPGVLGDDGLHYEGDGREWFAQQLADAARAAVGV
jgi:lysophospholipase L1-like esterase